ncbi:MAG TPA: glycine cleavage system aminomethyltransferase GcvT [Lentisphaeria bacterium]|nr:MAG: glycine cleavage system protein T [Lentisphaerae bacterium GWF2_49_21]HBC88985.1 glycine cleavage system aminomethyltransferase GcvT [Lentisphaeria bacterium]
MNLTNNLKATPLYDRHLALGAKMVPFAGWLMPVQYAEGIIAEHKHTRTLASIFDIFHMGEFRVKGEGSAIALDKILARAVADQKSGTCRYNFLLNDKGTVIDDLIVYRIAENEFFIVVNAGTRDTDAARFRELLPKGISFTDESDSTAKIDLQGPESADVLVALGLKKESLPLYYRWMNTAISGIPCLLSRTGYTGELGFEIYFPADKSEFMWNLLLAQKNVKPAGLGARDTLRLEMGYPLYGHELNLNTTPVEAGFSEIIRLGDNRDFIGSDVLRNSQLKKRLVGIELDGRRAAREGTNVLIDGNPVGTVSSGAFSPSLEKSVAMAFISEEFKISDGMGLELATEKFKVSGKIASLPFYKSGTARINIIQDKL